MHLGVLLGALTSNSQFRRAYRCGLTLAAALAATVLATSSAWAAGEVIVTPEGGTEQTLSVADPQGPDVVRDHQYTVRGASGETTVTLTGLSIDALLRRADVDPYGFDGATVTGGGRTVRLSREQLTDGDAFSDGRPIFYVDEQGTHFLRPSSGPGDLNGEELITVGDEPIRVDLRKPSKLDVTISASRKQIRKGQSVRFSAAVTGATAGERVTVSWTFDGSGRAHGATVTHRFTRPGTYEVTVSATTDPELAGADDLVTIQVGKPPKGPNRKGGGTNPDASAPDSGAGTGTTSPTPPAAAPTPAPPTSPSASTPTSKPPAPKAPAPRAATNADRELQKRLAAAPAGGDPEQIEGVLLSDASISPAPARADAIRAARTGTVKDASDGAGSVPPAVWGTLAVLALLGSGAWWERRGIPRRKRV